MLAPIICDGRSGTTFLFDLLTSHPKIRGVREVFGPGKVRYRGITSQEILHESMVKLIKGEDRNTPSDSYFTTTYFHGHAVKDVDNYFRKRGAKIILLKRNLVDIALSRCLVEQSKRKDNCSHDESFRKPYKNQRVTIDKEMLILVFRNFDTAMNVFPKRFCGLNVTTVNYEDLVKTRQEECKRLLDFLELKPMRLKLIEERPNPLVKQRLLPREEAIINYSELLRFFKKTKYEKYFYEENV